MPMEEEEEEDDEQPLFYCRALDGWCCNGDCECLLRGRKWRQSTDVSGMNAPVCQTVRRNATEPYGL